MELGPQPEGSQKIATIMPVTPEALAHLDEGIFLKQVALAMAREGEVVSDITYEVVDTEALGDTVFPQIFEGWVLPPDIKWVRAEAWAIPHVIKEEV